MDKAVLTDRYSRILAAVLGDCWAIMPEKLLAVLDFIQLQAEGVKFDAAEIADRTGGKTRREPQTTGPGVAVLPLFGVMAHRMNMMTEISGGTSTEVFGQWFDAAVADSGIGTIVLDIDSPGGSVHGLQELSDKVFAARGQKRIIAVANDLAASAAYYVATAADQVVVTPGGLVGSVGTLGIHAEASEADKAAGVKYTLISAGRNKTEGNPFEPLTDAAHDELQRLVDSYYDQFVSDVARNRGIKKREVLGAFGQGRVYGGKDAIERGMADSEATLDEVLASLPVAPEGSHDVGIRRRQMA